MVLKLITFLLTFLAFLFWVVTTTVKVRSSNKKIIPSKIILLCMDLKSSLILRELFIIVEFCSS